MSFWDNVAALAENAPESGYTNYNFGKLIATPMVVHWTNDPENGAVKHTKPLEEGYVLKEGEYLEISFKVLISELNPKLGFDYERDVPVRKSGRQKTDWSETVLPSLVKVFGKDWAKKIGEQPYVKVEDVPVVSGKASATGKVYTTIKFIEAYSSKEECIQARNLQYTPRNRSEDDVSVSASTETVAVPELVINQVKGLIASMGKEQAEKILASKPFGDYEADVLIKLAS